MKLKGNLRLPVYVSAFAIFCYAVSTFLTNNTASAASKISATATGSINILNSGSNNSNINSKSNQVEYNLNFRLNSAVDEGDYVEFATTGLSIIPNSSIRYNGVVIAKIEKQDSLDDDYISQQGQSINSDTIPLLSSTTYYKVIFNKNAEGVQNLSFDINNNGVARFVRSNTDYNSVMSVYVNRGVLDKQNGSLVVSKDVTIAKEIPRSEIKINEITGMLASFNDYDNNKITSSSMGVYLAFSKSSLVTVGDYVTVNIENNLASKKPLTIGSKIKLPIATTSTYSDQRYNKNGALILEKTEPLEVEVVESSENQVKLKLLTTPLYNRYYSLNFYNVEVIDTTKVDTANKRFPFEGTMKVENNNGLISNNKKVFNLSYASSKSSTSRNIEVSKSSVFAKYIDESGKEIAKAKIVLDNQKYGTLYDDNEISIDGYEFVGLDDKSVPKNGKAKISNQTIIYVYKKISAKEVAGQENSRPTETTPRISAPSTGIGKDNDIFSLIILVISIISIIMVSLKLSVFKKSSKIKY